MEKKLFQIKIELLESRPKIWRRLLITSDTLLPDLHKIIQTAMGWTNSHLHQFIKEGTFYTVRMKDDDFWDEMNNVDYRKMKISDLLQNEHEQIVYEYDFGDSWMHDIVLEKMLPFDNKLFYPVCLDGKMSCPPEDCGGIWGYSDILKILKQPNNKEYRSIVEWLGGEFDAQYFDKDEVNARFKRKDFGCIEL